MRRDLDDTSSIATTMPRLVVAEGAALTRVLDVLPQSSREGLSAEAFATFERAVQKTTWAAAHRRRFALMDGDVVLATAVRGQLDARLADRPVRICAIGSLWAGPAESADAHASALIATVLDAARDEGADLALLVASSDGGWAMPDGFEPMPATDVEVRVVESTRHGAPMTLVRGGEDRDLAAIVAMGEVRARLSRFHLVRDADFVKFALTRRRLLAGLAPAGQRALRFLIAEEGITAAAYLVLTEAAGSWTIEECGDRDAAGARVGALLQATVAREPVETRPAIRGWLPPTFSPPQLILTPSPSPAVLFSRGLSARLARFDPAADQVLFWRNDLF
jgi:hypothetical protein